jgi:Tol biopolymer transport system component
VFGAATAISELNSSAQDGQPNLRRDGLEIFFFSNRPGSAGNDIYAATRASTREPWSAPVNLGPNVNSAASETRPSLSWDGTALYFGSTRGGGEGDSDHYVTTRDRLIG